MHSRALIAACCAAGAKEAGKEVRRFEANQRATGRRHQHRKMVKLIFRCNRTGMNVQIEMPEMAPTDHADSYETVTCPACARVHLINKTTGRMLGDNDK